MLCRFSVSLAGAFSFSHLWKRIHLGEGFLDSLLPKTKIESCHHLNAKVAWPGNWSFVNTVTICWSSLGFVST